jgi:hypothetical protein
MAATRKSAPKRTASKSSAAGKRTGKTAARKTAARKTPAKQTAKKSVKKAAASSRARPRRTPELEALGSIRVCTILEVPEGSFVRAAIAAVEENPDNAPIREIRSGGGLDPRGPLRMALVTEKRWRPGRTLRVKFLDGVASVQEKVARVAKQWEEHANLKLELVNTGAAEIRISFKQSGSWSYLGTDALVIAANQPTMNYGWLTPTTNDSEYSRVVLHEFGHAFACIHEHQHPDAGIPWDREMVYRYYKATNGWDQAMTDRNVLDRYSATVTNFSAFDGTSIMQYSVPEELTIGDFAIGWNTQLSATDRSFIGTMYPKETAEAGQLKAGSSVSGTIGAHGEEDHYWFDVAHGGTGKFVIDTTGSTDVLMGLYGPDDPAKLIATDDDSGVDRNARIVRKLGPGRYTVRVRHYSPRGTGAYEVRLRRV